MPTSLWSVPYDKKDNPITTRLYLVTYCHGDKSHPCPVGIGLSSMILYSEGLKQPNKNALSTLPNNFTKISSNTAKLRPC